MEEERADDVMGSECPKHWLCEATVNEVGISCENECQRFVKTAVKVDIYIWRENPVTGYSEKDVKFDFVIQICA